MADPSIPRQPGSGVPARRLSTEQVEAVVRRAVELQARESDTTSDAGVTEHELIRIGGEIGIAPGHMQRALAEVSVNAEAGGGAGDRLFGAARISASRAVPGNAEHLRAQIERYLVESQYLAVLRRLADRTVFEKSRGLQVELTRVMDATRVVVAGGARAPRIGAGFDLRTARTVEVAVTPIDERSAWVTFVVDLGNQRVGYWAGLTSAGGASALVAAAVAAIAVAPPAALVALPIVGASTWGARALYGGIAKRARLHLEALLDHLERGEALVPDRPGSLPRSR